MLRSDQVDVNASMSKIKFYCEWVPTSSVDLTLQKIEPLHAISNTVVNICATSKPAYAQSDQSVC